MLSPYLGGDAVYTARVMLGIDPRDYNLFNRFGKTNETESINSIRVYPNPVAESAAIEIKDGLKNGWVTAELFDMMGKKVLSKKIQIVSSIGILDLKNLQNGVYLLSVRDEIGNSKSTKVVIQN